jgi:hypothetical protein
MNERVRTIEDTEEHLVADPVPPALVRADAVERAPAGSESQQDADLLLPADRRDGLRREWLQVQSSFIDEPQAAVSRADSLVQDLLRSVADGFEGARRDLEGEWQRGEGVNTESLRLAFRRYRALFDRLLAV